MECQNTIKNLKINKNKTIGTIVVLVEGEEDEFRLLKHIFTNVLNYNYISLKRNKILKHEFISKNNKNTVIVANTKSSSIKSLLEDNEYKDKLYNLLTLEYNRSLKNTNIYIIWDRDKDIVNDTVLQQCYKKAINTFYSALDNDYEMNGLLLLSYPCHESYLLSNFKKNLFNISFKTSSECKKAFHTSKFSIISITETTLLLAVKNMHEGLIKYNILNYDPSNLKDINEKVFRQEEKSFKENNCFNALSLISMMFIDLGIIEIMEK